MKISPKLGRICAVTALSAAFMNSVHAVSSDLSDASIISGSVGEESAVVYLPHDIQGAGITSPLVGEVVTVEGVVTGRRANGFFIQTQPGNEDSDSATSEGLFVSTDSAPPAGASVGTLVQVTGTVTEFSGDGAGVTRTELAGAPSVVAMGPAARRPTAVPLTSLDLSPTGGLHQLERFEGMLITVGTMISVSGTDGFFDAAAGGEAAGVVTSAGVFYAVLDFSRPAREAGIAAPRAAAFADQCAAGPPCNIPVFDTNPERLRVDSDALGAPALNLSANVLIDNTTAIVDSGLLTWSLLPVPSSPGSPSANLGPIPAGWPASDEFTVATLDLQGFYDTVDDAGADVPLTAANYDNHLAKASLVIRDALWMPDILAVRGVETIAVLSDLAARVNTDAGVSEYSAHLVEGNDPSGLDVGFLVRARVTPQSVLQVGKDATFTDPDDGSEDVLNDWPSLVLRAQIAGPDGRSARVIVVANHLDSQNGSDSTTSARQRVKRQKQAEFLAARLDELQAEGAVISVGDYNALDVNEGLVDVMGTVLGAPTPGDQVVLASPAVVDPPFVLSTTGLYSAVVEGNTQPLDHVALSSKAQDLYVYVQHARINADFPETDRNDPGRMERLSDRDPVVAYFRFAGDTTPPTFSGVPADITVEGDTLGGAQVTYTAPTADDNLDGSVVVSCSPLSGSLFPVATTTVTCSTSDVAGNTATATFNVTVTDTNAPTLTVPNAMTLQATSPSGAVVHYTATAQDIVAGPLTPECVPASGTTFPIGTTVVACQANDGNGNTALESFDVTVEDPRTTGAMAGAGKVRNGAVDTTFFFAVQERVTERGWLLAESRQGRTRLHWLISLHVTSVFFSSDIKTVTFTGVAWVDGRAGYTFEATAMDNGWPGTRDMFSLTVKDPSGATVLSAGGNLTTGNIQSKR